MDAPPHSEIEAVTEILHGVPITDRYRWLEDQDSPRTRNWIAAQVQYTRSYLDFIPGREQIRERIRELLDVETYDSLQKFGSRYFFRKRLPGQEQPCICVRDGLEGPDEVLIDPAQRGTGPYTAVKPLRVSPDGRLLLYEVKQGGERTGTFELLDIQTRETLPDKLDRGYLRGFAFSPDSKGFYYVHESRASKRPHHHAAYRHIVGTDFADDVEVFFASEDERIRLHLIPGAEQIGFLIVRFSEKTLIDFYVWPYGSTDHPDPVIKNAEYRFGPLFSRHGRILAITDRGATNFRVIEVFRTGASEPEFRDIVPPIGSPIQNWALIGDRIFVSYFRRLQTEIDIFDLQGKRLGRVPVDLGYRASAIKCWK